MNVKILLLAIFIAGFGSCTTAYKSAQTPDDVYYSPAPPIEEKIETEKEEDRTVYNESEEDREIRQRIRDRRWRYNDDYYYSYHPYYNNSYVTYCSHPKGYYYYFDPKSRSTVTYYPRKFNFNVKNSGTNTNVNPKTGQTYGSGNAPVRTFRSNSVGNTIKKVLSNATRPTRSSSTTRSSDNSTPVRTFDNKSSSGSNNSSSNSSSSSSSSSGSSGSAPVRTFNK